MHPTDARRADSSRVAFAASCAAALVLVGCGKGGVAPPTEPADAGPAAPPPLVDGPAALADARLLAARFDPADRSLRAIAHLRDAGGAPVEVSEKSLELRVDGAGHRVTALAPAGTVNRAVALLGNATSAFKDAWGPYPESAVEEEASALGAAGTELREGERLAVFALDDAGLATIAPWSADSLTVQAAARARLRERAGESAPGVRFWAAVAKAAERFDELAGGDFPMRAVVAVVDQGELAAGEPGVVAKAAERARAALVARGVALHVVAWRASDRASALATAKAVAVATGGGVVALPTPDEAPETALEGAVAGVLSGLRALSVLEATLPAGTETVKTVAFAVKRGDGFLASNALTLTEED